MLILPDIHIGVIFDYAMLEDYAVYFSLSSMKKHALKQLSTRLFVPNYKQFFNIGAKQLMEKAKNRTNETIYEPSSQRKSLFFAACVVFLFPSFMVFLSDGIWESWLGIFMLGVTALIFFILWFIALWTIGTRYRVSDEGIEFQEGKMRIFSTWENLQEFKMESGTRGFALHTHAAMERQVQGLQKSIYAQQMTHSLPLSPMIDLPKERIPSELYVETCLRRFENTALGEAIHAYAPHLFDRNKDAEKRKNKLSDESDLEMQTDGELMDLEQYKRLKS